MVTIRIPAPPPGLFANLLGLAGIIAAVLAVGGLTGNWWWSVLAAGAAAIVMSVIAQQNAAEEAEEPAGLDATTEIPRLAARSRSA